MGKAQVPKTVLITTTTWWPTSSHLAISLASAGLQVAAIHPKCGHPLARTSAVAVRFVYEPLRPLQSLRLAILHSAADLIVPCDDRTVAHLHRLHEAAIDAGPSMVRLAQLIERSLGNPAAFSVVSSRIGLLQAAAACGILVPDSAPVTTSAELDRWSRTKPLPWFIKADSSWGGLGVKPVADPAEAVAVVAAMRRPLGAGSMLKRLIVNRDTFWIEPWWTRRVPALSAQVAIDGRPANIVVFACRGEIMASIAVEVVSAQSKTGPATIVKIVEGGKMLEAAATLVRKLQLAGYLGFDFILERNSGAPYLIELNARCAMPGHLRIEGNRDLSAAVFAELTGESANPPAYPIHQDTVAYFPQAWLAHPAAAVLRTAYHDVPWSEPGLLRELMLLSWPDRSFLARTADRMRGVSIGDRQRRRVDFLPASTHPLPPDHA